MKKFLKIIPFLTPIAANAQIFVESQTDSAIHRVEISNATDKRVDLTIKLQVGQLKKGQPENDGGTEAYCYTIPQKNLPMTLTLVPHMHTNIYLEADALKYEVDGGVENFGGMISNCAVVTITTDKHVFQDAFYLFGTETFYTKTDPDVFTLKIVD